jgi:hypothetical protein
MPNTCGYDLQIEMGGLRWGNGQNPREFDFREIFPDVLRRYTPLPLGVHPRNFIPPLAPSHNSQVNKAATYPSIKISLMIPTTGQSEIPCNLNDINFSPFIARQVSANLLSYRRDYL